MQELLGRATALDECDAVGPRTRSRRRGEVLPREHAVAVLAPMSGSAGIWGPSCISSAQLAIHEINQRAGISGAPIVPLFMDSDDSAGGALEREIAALIERGVARASAR